MKKALSLFLALALCFGALAVPALAADASGSCGENLTWEFSKATGTLTISGTGAMGFYYEYESPWRAYKNEIKSVVIEDGVTSVSYRAFYNCESLTSVSLPAGVKSIADGAFSRCGSLTDVVFSDGLISIGQDAFRNCNLTSVVLPDGVTNIGDNAFAGNAALTNVVIPDSVIYMGQLAFSGSPWIKTLGDFPIVHGILLGYERTSQNVVIPDGVTNIANGVFAGFTGLVSVVIPEGVTRIGGYAFNGCGLLKSVVLPDSVTSIGFDAFANCAGLESITIGSGVAEIGNEAFLGTPWLAAQGEFPTVNGILLRYQGGDTDVKVPAGVTKIAYGAFRNCASLTSVALPSGVTYIGEYAFYGCAALTSVTIPASVTAIDWMAFFELRNLTDIYYGGSEAQWAAIEIGDYNESLQNVTIHFNSATEPAPEPTPEPAPAPKVVLSPQNLSVNGGSIDCMKYNIDGSNYFKLRDLAQLLNGTGSQFDVGWDAEKGVVSITTNHAYTTPNGTELVVGADQSATTQVSAQTIMINGAVRTDLTVYNIGGSNFFKLRDLGDALGFDVDYDAATNTAIVLSR